ncbi:unnamed protein product [Cylicocyclus nassatus]|uniref:Uncharacterized protein n=1 Tax=Cylicocyclus nassatus TaxID=53992 RepID=A0AA36GVB3_CYLNA|nr:unnamed protein product [Cylicocyclus nassatus]
MDNMMPSPYRGRNSGQWRGGGAQARGRRSNDFQSPFASPYQNTWGSPADGSAQRRPYGRGSPSPRYQSNQGGYQNSGRSSYGGFRGTPGSSYKNRNQNGQKEVDIRAYVIPAMTQNPWKDLEEQWKSEKAAGVDNTVNQQ